MRGCVVTAVRTLRLLASLYLTACDLYLTHDSFFVFQDAAAAPPPHPPQEANEINAAPPASKEGPREVPGDGPEGPGEVATSEEQEEDGCPPRKQGGGQRGSEEKGEEKGEQGCWSEENTDLIQGLAKAKCGFHTGHDEPDEPGDDQSSSKQRVGTDGEQGSGRGTGTAGTAGTVRTVRTVRSSAPHVSCPAPEWSCPRCTLSNPALSTTCNACTLPFCGYDEWLEALEPEVRVRVKH